MSVLGPHMMREMRAAGDVFARAVVQDVAHLSVPPAIYTFARGSSDAVANVLSYEFMDHLGVPVTSLPPSVFSLGEGVDLGDAMGLVVSQSGGSDDLVACARAVAHCVAITNVAGSPVEGECAVTVPVGAGVENAVPATKTVIGSLAAGMALLAAMQPAYRKECQKAADVFGAGFKPFAPAQTLIDALAPAQHVYVLGRRCSFGVAQEVALKLKETCALHAEAYSASEVLHGPLQLSTKPLTVLILDGGDAASQPSLDAAQMRFEGEGARVLRVGAQDAGVAGLAGPAVAAGLLNAMYPVIHAVAVQLGHDPDTPRTLQKVTRTL